MKSGFQAGTTAIFCICLSLALGSFAYTQTKSGTSHTGKKETAMTMHANGTFDVKLTPQDDKSDDPSMGRMTIDLKQFRGDLEATSKGQMLYAGGDPNG